MMVNAVRDCVTGDQTKLFRQRLAPIGCGPPECPKGPLSKAGPRSRTIDQSNGTKRSGVSGRAWGNILNGPRGSQDIWENR